MLRTFKVTAIYEASHNSRIISRGHVERAKLNKKGRESKVLYHFAIFTIINEIIINKAPQISVRPKRRFTRSLLLGVRRDVWRYTLQTAQQYLHTAVA